MVTVTTLEPEEVRRITAYCRFVEQSFRAAGTWPDTKKFPPTVLETALDGCPEAGGKSGKWAQDEILRALKGRVQVPLPTPRAPLCAPSALLLSPASACIVLVPSRFAGRSLSLSLTAPMRHSIPAEASPLSVPLEVPLVLPHGV